MDSSETTPSEHRSAPRRRVLKSAKILLDDLRIMNCAIRDVSETGAQLRIGGQLALPHRFRLVMLADNTIRPVQVAWKHKDTIGVAFAGEATKAPMLKW